MIKLIRATREEGNYRQLQEAKPAKDRPTGRRKQVTLTSSFDGLQDDLQCGG
jgi:hypothetical protein